MAELYTDLSVEECQRRLYQATSRDKIIVLFPRLYMFLADKPVLALIRGDRFRLRRRIFYRNDLQFGVYGKLEATPNGTRITTRTSYQTFILLILVMVFPAMCAFLSQILSDGPLFLTTLHRWIRGEADVAELMVHFILVTGTECFYLLCILVFDFLGYSSTRYLYQYLAAALECKTIPLPPPPLYIRAIKWLKPSHLYLAGTLVLGGGILLLSAIIASRLPLMLHIPILWLGDFTAPLLAGWLLVAIHARYAPISLTTAIGKGLLLGGLCVGITLMLTLEPLSAWPPLYLLAMGTMGGVGGYLGGRQFAG